MQMHLVVTGVKMGQSLSLDERLFKFNNLCDTCYRVSDCHITTVAHVTLDGNCTPHCLLDE